MSFLWPPAVNRLQFQKAVLERVNCQLSISRRVLAIFFWAECYKTYKQINANNLKNFIKIFFAQAFT